jgi:hypothetical protein
MDKCAGKQSRVDNSPESLELKTREGEGTAGPCMYRPDAATTTTETASPERDQMKLF